MNKKVLWVIGAIVVIGVAAWLVMSKKGSPASENNQVASSDQNSGQGSLKDLAASGISKKCSYSDPTNSAATGTVYVAGGKMRTDYSSVVNGQTTNGHMISDGTTIYTWMEGMATGFKMSASAQSDQNANQQAVDANKSVNYNCAPWSEDSTTFSLPTGVAFSDLTQMMIPPITPTSTTPTPSQPSPSSSDMKSQQCSVCNQLSGSQQTQCKAAYSCP